MDLELSVEIKKEDGRTVRLAPESYADQLPTAISFSTKRMEGFDAGGFTLARHVLSESRDVELYDTVRFVANDGSIAYEGRIAGLPRQLDDGHSQGVEIQGWMAHLRDRSFRQVFVDRDLSAWNFPISAEHKLALVGTFFPITNGSAASDRTATGGAALVTSINAPWGLGPYPLSEAWYDIGEDAAIQSVEYAWRTGANLVWTDTGWTWALALDTDDAGVSTQNTGNLRAVGPGTGTLTATTSDRQYAHVALFYGGFANVFQAEYELLWTTLAVHGRHGLVKRDLPSDSASGYYASDIIRWIVDNHCPQVSSVGVQDTSYAIPHAVFKDRIDPYDAMLALNAYHLWDAAVWEGPILHYYPPDLTDYDWEVRTDDPGVQIQWQGDTTDQLANGIAVQFTNVVTGRAEYLLPTDHDELRDDSLDHPANRHNIQDWEELQLTLPTTLANALEIGRAKLAESNQPKAPGQFTIAGGYVRDRQGNRQPAWKVRASDTIAITDHPNASPRLITETRWENDTKVLTVATDSEIKRLDAFLDRTETALKALNLA